MSAFIEARELRKTYRVGKVDVPALRGISFSVQKGDFVTVVGPSGSGKSTLFFLLGGLTRADSGSVTIDGVDFATLSDGERTRLRKSKIGFVFQKFNLLPTLSARSNIEIAGDIAGLGAPDPAFLKKITGMLGIAERLEHRPNELSGGAAASRAGPRSYQPPRDRARRRAHRQPGFEKLEHRSRHVAPIEPESGADRADDYAQSRSRRVWRPHRAHARWPNRDARGRPAVVSPSTSGSHTVLNRF